MKLKKITHIQAFNKFGDNCNPEVIYNTAIDDMAKLKAEKKAKKQSAKNAQSNSDKFEWTPELIERFNSWNPEAQGKFDVGKLIAKVNSRIIEQAEHLKDMFSSQERENGRLHEMIAELSKKIEVLRVASAQMNNQITENRTMACREYDYLNEKIGKLKQNAPNERSQDLPTA